MRALAASAIAAAAIAAPDASWLAYGHDAQITNFTPAPAFTTKVKGFATAWRAPLDGGVMASPLAAPIPGRGLVVFASTSKGNVYAIGPGGA